MTTAVTLGVIPAPDLADMVVAEIVDDLPELLRQIDDEVTWDVRVRRDPLVGAGTSVEVLKEAESQRADQEWNFALAVTDLPLRSGGRVVVADVGADRRTAVVSLPALGAGRLRYRVRDALVSLVRDVYETGGEDAPAPSPENAASLHAGRLSGAVSDMVDTGIGVRYALPWKRGHVKLIAGLVRANRPWEVLGAFKGALAATFATAAYALIFPSAWNLSDAMGVVRPLLIMLLSLAIMVAWIIIAHHLWERPGRRPSPDPGLIRLYNTVTACTLTSITVFGYLVLFAVIFGMTWLFIPLHYFGRELGTAAGVVDYLRLTWLLSSLAMLAAALGQGLDDDETVRRATFGYRQTIRTRQQQRDDRSTEA